jgi:acetylglutamate kinase
MHADFIPIICSIGSNEEGRLFNVNADQAATCIASLLYADLYFLSDVSGVLDATKARLAVLSEEEVSQLVKDGVIIDGMEVKVRAAQDAAQILKKPVMIGSWSEVASLTGNGDRQTGTQIRVNS